MNGDFDVPPPCPKFFSMAASRDARYGIREGGIVASIKYAVHRLAGMYFPPLVDFNADGASGLLKDAMAGKADDDCGNINDDVDRPEMAAMDDAV